MKLLKYTIFPENKMTYRDGVIAAGFLLLFFMFSYLTIYWSKELISVRNFYYNIFASSLYVLPCLLIIYIVKVDGQDLETIGINREKLKSSFGIGIPILFIAIALNIFNHGAEDIKINYLLQQLFLVTISEELIFRGYASPRLSKAFGNFSGLIIAGVIFGIYQSITPIVYFHVSIWSMFGYIGLGIFTQMILQYFYTRTNNIVLPILLHASYDMLIF